MNSIVIAHPLSNALSIKNKGNINCVTSHDYKTNVKSPWSGAVKAKNMGAMQSAFISNRLSKAYGHTKVTKKIGTKKQKFQLEQVNKQTFEKMKDLKPVMFS